MTATSSKTSPPPPMWRLVSLHMKATVFLMSLLACAVSLCGLVFISITKSIFHNTLALGLSEPRIAAQINYLHASILLSCLGVLLVAVPVAALMARHLTGPIQRLARATQALATGDLGYRVTIERSDEIGELARAFNTMAERLQAQQQDIRQINAGLEETVQARTAELEKVNARLEVEIAEKEDFLRAVSHDLNAPLRNISGMAAILLLKYQGRLEQDAVTRLERIQKNVEVECNLINELLELSRIKSHREKLEHFDLHTLVADVAEGFSNDFETRGITFAITTPLPVMYAEKSRVRQVFQNLIDNAVKYMRPDGPRQIALRLVEEDNAAIFIFSDTGIGIAADDLPQIFHVFRRAKNAVVMKVPGKGVGLASVKSIVETYNGRIRADSEPGVGTTFYIAIPRQYFNFSDSPRVPEEVAV